MKILCIGHAAYDITFLVESFPIENTKNRIKNRVECGGGPSATAAYLLGKWNMDCSFAGIVGDDLYGKNIYEEFKSVNVDTKYLQISEQHSTTSSFIVANYSNGSRTILTHRPSEMKMEDIELDFEPDIILIDGQEYEMSKKIISKYPHAISIIDASRNTGEIIELSKMVNYLVCSKDFSEKLTGLKVDYDNLQTAVEVYKKMEEMFDNTIVITLESHGCLYKKDGVIKQMPSIKVKAIDSTGAGDIFHGAFTYCVANNFDFEKTLRFSNIAGAISVTRVGSKNSIATLEEMEKIYNEYR